MYAFYRIYSDFNHIFMNYFELLSRFSELRETIAAIFKHIAVNPNQKTATLDNCDEARNCDIERKPFLSFAL